MQLCSILFLIFFLNLPVFAAQSLPYSIRTQDYSGWSPAAQSDTNTTGMAGATVALPSSISSAESNPAGFAMETGSVSAQINRISIRDQRIQSENINSSQWGLGVSPPPWGFSLSYYSPITESGDYLSPTTGESRRTEVSLKELRLTAARSFLDGHLAIGLSGEFTKAVREFGPYSYNSYAPSFRLGALYRGVKRIILGFSYAPPLTIGPDSEGPSQNELPGFNRALLRPSQLTLGVGWIPNRFFKTGISIARVGNTANTALLSNQSSQTGMSPTWIPRVGASYILAQFNNFSSELAMGSYFDTSRIQGQSNRLHGTIALEVNPYFVNLGVGADLSRDYRNFMIGVGIDIVRTLRTFNIVPRDPTPPMNGFFPKVTQISAEGLPDTMTQGEPKTSSPPTLGDVKQIVKDIPENIVNKVKGKPTTVDKKTKKNRGNGGAVNFRH